MSRPIKRSPPPSLYVGWCATCGGTIVADRDRRQARDGSGCHCVVGKEDVRAIRYVLAPEVQKAAAAARRRPRR